MAPQATAVSLLSSSAITSRLSASAVAPHYRPAPSQAVPLSSHDALVSSRLSGGSSTSGRSSLTSGWRGNKIATPVCQAALFEFLKRSNKKDKELIKGKLLLEIARVDRGAEATPEDQERIEKIVQELEALNPTKEPLNSPLINGKWMLLYTTSESILKKNRQKFLRPSGPIYQAINTDTLRAQNLETWPFFNQVTANLSPVSSKKVVVNFDYFKIGGLGCTRVGELAASYAARTLEEENLIAFDNFPCHVQIKIKAPGRARGELEFTYLDENLRISRGDKGNLFVLQMNDPSYKVPVAE